MTSTSSPRSPILLLGGTGKVSTRIAVQLHAASLPLLSASRSGKPAVSGPGAHGVAFDWLDESTYANPFSHPAAVEAGGIKEVFLVAPPIMDMGPPMKLFIDMAKERGVKRFVLLSATALEPGTFAMGIVHAYLKELEGIEYAVLRPSWFMENFITQEPHLKSIREESSLYSAAEDGRIPWVSADDIAACAVQALTMPEPPNTDYLILGPELLSYSDIAKIMTDVLGRQIVHRHLSPAELEARLQSFGMPEDYSQMMSALDTAIKHGKEELVNDVVLALTGRKPRSFREWAVGVKDQWTEA